MGELEKTRLLHVQSVSKKVLPPCEKLTFDVDSEMYMAEIVSCRPDSLKGIGNKNSGSVEIQLQKL